MLWKRKTCNEHWDDCFILTQMHAYMGLFNNSNVSLFVSNDIILEALVETNKKRFT